MHLWKIILERVKYDSEHEYLLEFFGPDGEPLGSESDLSLIEELFDLIEEGQNEVPRTGFWDNLFQEVENELIENDNINLNDVYRPAVDVDDRANYLKFKKVQTIKPSNHQKKHEIIEKIKKSKVLWIYDYCLMLKKFEIRKIADLTS